MMAGKQITSTLRLERLLGEGGMGSVWVADHLGLGIQVAVKFVAPAFAQDRGIAERFRLEAMAAARIKGANIAQVFDHGRTDEGVPFIVMELLEGEDLAKLLARQVRLDPAEIVAIVRQVAKALGRAHHLGIVHRDIKPDNIFLSESDGELLVKLLDFGIAKVGQADVNLTNPGALLGTPLYMSPEQFLSAKDVDFRADLWSLGAVVFKALTGAPPFPGEDMSEISLAVHTAPIPKVRAVRPELPLEVDAWFEKAFSHDPSGRFTSAWQMAEELDMVTRGCPPSASHPVSGPVSSAMLIETVARDPTSSPSGARATPARTFEGETLCARSRTSRRRRRLPPRAVRRRRPYHRRSRLAPRSTRLLPYRRHRQGPLRHLVHTAK